MDKSLTLNREAALLAVLGETRRRQWRLALVLAALGAGTVAAFAYTGMFDPERYRDALGTMLALARDAWPPDFRRWPEWGRPLLETLAMSVAGTVLGALLALPLSLVGAGQWLPSPLGAGVRLLLSTLRSIPGVVWGVLFVAAVGFGPLPGAFALTCHSTGMLGKFYGEILAHVDPGPGNALRSQGVSRLGVWRFSLLPQILPRLADVTLYRWEYNLRAATVLGIVGAGGLGLEIVTAFHLFEYREAMALILVLLGLVTVINLAGDRLRAWFVSHEQ